MNLHTLTLLEKVIQLEIANWTYWTDLSFVVKYKIVHAQTQNEVSTLPYVWNRTDNTKKSNFYISDMNLWC
jgi:hypothetical protein